MEPMFVLLIGEEEAVMPALSSGKNPVDALENHYGSLHMYCESVEPEDFAVRVEAYAIDPEDEETVQDLFDEGDHDKALVKELTPYLRRGVALFGTMSDGRLRNPVVADLE